MNLVPWTKRKRWNDDPFWAPLSVSPRSLLQDFFDSDRVFPERSEFSPALDVSEDENAYRLNAELPGVDPKDVHVTVESGVLTLRGEKKEESEKKEKNYHRLERRYGSFSRSLRFPVEVDAEKVEARYNNGVLEITVPKAESVKPKRIEVKVQ